jgi:competence protein ComEA
MLKKILAVLAMLFFAAVAMAAVDVNKADQAQLDSVKGIGPVTSKLIMSERKKGEFKDWKDFVDRVKGIGESRAAKLSAEGLTVNGTSYKAAAAKDEKKAAKETKAAAKEEKKEAKAEASKPMAAEAKKPASAKK